MIKIIPTIHIGGRQKVSPNEVVMLQADVNYTIVYFSNGMKSMVATPLKALELRFSGHDFIRVHKSYIVNSGCIIGYNKHNSGYSVELSNDQTINVSRRNQSKLKKFLKN